MSNYILKYSRTSRVKYISHLDFVRMFHRAVRRANLPFVFSQGFNPHPIMTVASPLSVGVTADGEYMKVGFDTKLSEEEIKALLNSALPDGFKVISVTKAEGKEYDFNKITQAEYFIDAQAQNPERFDVDAFSSLAQITVMKKSKSSVKEVDIKSLIFSLENTEPESGNIGLRLICAAGNSATLKPENVVDAINKYQPDVKIEFFSSHRVALLTADGTTLL